MGTRRQARSQGEGHREEKDQLPSWDGGSSGRFCKSLWWRASKTIPCTESLRTWWRCRLRFSSSGYSLRICISFILIFIDFWLFWVFFCCTQAFSSCSKQGLLSSCSLGTSHCSGFSCCRARALSAGASVAVAHRLNCPAASAIFPDQGWNPCPLYWQVESYPLDHQGKPDSAFLSSNPSNWGPGVKLWVHSKAADSWPHIHRFLCYSLYPF